MSQPVESYERAVAVTPSDVAEIDCEAFYVGAAGSVAVVAKRGGGAVTLVGCLAGHIYRIACSKIMATNTTAANIVALS